MQFVRFGLISLLALASATSFAAYKLETGKSLPPLTIDGTHGGNVKDGGAWNSTSMNGTLNFLVYVDPDDSELNDALIDRLHQRDFDVAIVNAGGLTHTSIALRDALLAVQRPFFEVHLSDPSSREAFRHVNYLHDIATESIVGQGARGYHLALESVARRWGARG